ncbi:L,D-transpeptidase [Nonomuraea sp. KM90]|uniref:L,D-transpeptidase n=1 Tax=Nonomuraea sp. KM90 TaxID=3457428 RepID=UPI003FCCAEBF
MSLLELRYRSVLRLLPASYRAGREEEMVDAFLESAGDPPDEANARPRWGEIASVLALSVRVRLGGAGAPARFVAWGETVRLVALFGLAYQSTGSVFVAADLIRALVFGPEFVLMGAPGSADRLLSIGVAAAAVCWAVAFVAIMRGHVLLAKVTALLGAAPTVAYFVIPAFLAGPRPPAEAANLVFVAVPVIALLLGFHSDVTPWRRPWPLALTPPAAGLALLGTAWLVVRLRPQDAEWLYLWLDLGTTVPVWAVTSVVVLARRRSPSWALALAVAGLLVLAARLPMLVNLPEGPQWTTAGAQCVLLGALSLVLVGAGLRGLPRARAA